MPEPSSVSFSDHSCLLDSLSDGFFLLDHQDRIQFANSSAKNLLESHKDSTGKELWEVLPKDLSSKFQHELSMVRQSQKTVHFESHYQSTCSHWIDVKLFPNPNGVSALIRDITSQKEVEHKIQENHIKLILLTEAANHIISHEEPKKLLDSLFNELSDFLDLDVYFNYIYDKEIGKLRLMNYSGIDKDTAKEIEWLEMGEAVCGYVAQKTERFVVEEIENSNDQRVSLLKDLGIKAYACHPLFSYGRMIGTLSFGSSKRAKFSTIQIELMETICNQVAMALERTFLITELKNTNTELSANFQKLEESEKKFRDIFTGALDGIMLIDTEGNILNANPSACHKLGVKREDILAKNLKEFFSVIKLGKSQRVINITLKDGTERLIEYSSTKEITPGNHLIIFRDITTKDKITKALIEAKEQAETASKAKSEFLSMMSHELRTPLNSILGFSQIMLDDSKNSLNDIQKDRILKILKSGRHLIHLINEILEHSQIESGKVRVSLENVNLQEVIEESMRLLLPIAEAKGVSIENKINAGQDIYVKGDFTRIKQILINLITNAIKYNNPNGKVTVHCKLKPKHIKICIADTGIGIPKDKLKQIFEPFYRIYHPEHNIEGTGIGLALVKNFVSMMGGSIGVKSKEAEGSSFWFTLPLSDMNSLQS